MMRRLMVGGLVIEAWFAAGIILDGCRPIERPSSAAPVVQDEKVLEIPTVQASAATAAAATTEPTAALNSSENPVWVWSIARLFRLKTQTGMVDARTGEVLSEAATIKERRVQYLVTTETRDGKCARMRMEASYLSST